MLFCQKKMTHIADEMVKYFSTTDEQGRYKSLNQFLEEKEIPENRKINCLITLQRLINHGQLISMATFEGTVFGYKYRSLSYNESNFQYGSYGFLAGGFQSIYNHFNKSVIALSTSKNGDFKGVGTSFYIYHNDIYWILTAGHVVRLDGYENYIDGISVLGNLPTFNIEKVMLPYSNEETFNQNHLLDIAVMKLSEPLEGLHPFILDSPLLLGEVMIMGYPELYCIDTTLICSTGQISAVDQEHRFYRRNVNLVSSRVKSGFSGSPVVNELGRVIGLVVSFGMGNDRDGRPDWDFQAHILKYEDIKKFFDEASAEPDTHDLKLINTEINGSEIRLHPV